MTNLFRVLLAKNCSPSNPLKVHRCKSAATQICCNYLWSPKGRKNIQFWFFGLLSPKLAQNRFQNRSKYKIWILNIPGSQYKWLNTIFEEFGNFLTQSVIDSSTVRCTRGQSLWSNPKISCVWPLKFWPWPLVFEHIFPQIHKIKLQLKMQWKCH